MVWLSGWLKTIVSIILLATFVELLLPSTTMQRYVRTVMSLFILLALLTPVMELFQKDWNVGKLLIAAEQKQTSSTNRMAGKPIDKLESIQAIGQQADQLKAANQNQSLQMVQAQIADTIKQQVKKQTQYAVDDVVVLTEFDNKGKPFIQQVRVTLHAIDKAVKKPEEQKRSDTNDPLHVEPIQPVQIHLNSIKDKPAKNTKEEIPSPELEREKQKIRESIEQNWQIEPGRIDVRIQTDKNKS